MLRLFEPKIPASTQTRIDGRLVEVAVRVSERARSYRLSLPHHGKPVLTVPRHGRWREAEAFLNRQTAWLAARLKRGPGPLPFAEGAAIPLRGVRHTIMGTGKVVALAVVSINPEEPGGSISIASGQQMMRTGLTSWAAARANV